MITHKALGLLLLASLTATGPARAVVAGPDEAKQIVAIEYDSCPIYLGRDDSKVAGFYADDFTNVGLDGSVLTDASLIRPTVLKVTSCAMDSVSARVHGDVAVAVGRMSLASALINATFRFTDTFLRKNGRWRLLASHQTAIKS